ncbi:hypothetical protein F183_A42980 [Bryobacterales bacterium F-183]|nr:hypothetical protein F183_A42980 [Bryobacterales bacterium F-183]
MNRFLSLSFALMALPFALEAQPALTSIQDILYRADGTRFSGTVSIQWKPFLSGDSSYIPQQALRIDVVNGVFRTKLVPTTNASAGANYEVKFASQGQYLFTETWAVPPSLEILKVRDVRVTSGITVGNPPVFGQLSQISDVAGLENELLLRPMRGFLFGLGRTAMINSTGQIDAVQGNLSDCVRVDGSSAPCGTGGSGGSGGGANFVDHETPGGLVNGSNATFTLASTPSPASSLSLLRNGLLLKASVDFTLSGNTITFFTASVPQSGDLLEANYRTATSGAGELTFLSPQVVCSGIGGSTALTGSTALATCTIPATSFQSGDRIEVRFGYVHTGGTTVAPRIGVRLGTNDAFTRVMEATDTAANGTISFVINSGTAEYFAETRGTTSASQFIAGTSSQSLASAVPITLRGSMSVAGTETVALRYFTVTRYPALLQ